jgi:hypothetical protein
MGFTVETIVKCPDKVVAGNPEKISSVNVP